MSEEMASWRARLGGITVEAMDDMQEGGELDFGPDATLRAAVVMVAVDHGAQTTIRYRFKDAQGQDLDRSTGQEIVRRVYDSIRGA